MMRFPDMPAHMLGLPRDKRGFPVPWFVAYIDGEPCFPVVEAGKVTRAHREELCWVCGGKLGKWRASVIGPMCAVNRTISEPQSHVECARFSAKRCPFLSRPNMKRMPLDLLPDTRIAPAGDHITRNPGVAAVWIEDRRTTIFKVGDGVLFELGEPDAVEWYCEGRDATRAEIELSIDSGLPLLIAACDKEPPGARREMALSEIALRRVKIGELLPA